MKRNGSNSISSASVQRRRRKTVAAYTMLDGGLETSPVCRGERSPEVIAEAESGALDPMTATHGMISSSCSEAGERVLVRARSSRLPCGDCSELLHDLSNTVTAVLMNAQVLGWKLPPYSHLKRPLRDLERAAQRGSELLKQLLRRVEVDAGLPMSVLPKTEVPAHISSVVTLRGEGATAARPASLLAPRSVAPLPGFLSAPALDLTSECDVCTSSHFPKGDDGKER